jgi:2-polyprenyl-3-methyl-5-hydroxy-6-metoxy-1,4-benzoquinol methylase
VSGVDVSDDMLSIAKHQLPTATFLRQDVTEQILSDKFDVISSFRFFLNAENSLRTATLSSLHKMLNDDGILIINVHVNKHSPLGCAYRLRNKLYGNVVANTLGFTEFSKFLTSAGFSIQETLWYGYLPRTGWMFGSFASVLLEPLERFCNGTGLFPKTWAQNFIVVCTKQDEK